MILDLKDCPGGFEWNHLEERCDCASNLKSYNIICNTYDYSLTVPSSKWIGEVRGQAVVQKYCQNCRNEGEKVLSDIMKSDMLCNPGRTGVLCGACQERYSLQLGVNTCAYCSDSTYKGVLLLLFFLVAGLILIFLLFSLNLTISTGLLNGLIFYSNIVYSNRDNFLPINGSRNSTHLQNVVQFLSMFQAWVNLDFGIITCFFNGFNTYISTWLQFTFPIYIWLLILLIILASRFSRRVSKLTTSNTVPVLATLFLLSYAKLLINSIAAVSFTYLHFLHNDTTAIMVWVEDGNIAYLEGKHIPLFLVSMLMLVFCIIPFTLLILLGPLLQAKSNYALLHWINKLKPLFDAFYGPYNGRYRYWPGILLLARFLLFNLFAFYSFGDNPYKFITILVH